MANPVPSILVGCAGWSIGATHAPSFPGIGSHLERYARVLDAVEINSSFYRQHRPQTYAKWAGATPEAFRFSVKVPRAISHRKRLRDCDEELQAFLGEVGCLGSKLGVLLLQLPPGLAFDPECVQAFFDGMRRRYAGPVACEPRHASWFGAGADAVLRSFHVARVAADPACVLRAAAPSGDRRVEYWRLHGSPRMYYDAYSDTTLRRLAKRLARCSPEATTRWCIFDNTAQGHALADATKLRAMIGDALADPVRAPGAACMFNPANPAA